MFKIMSLVCFLSTMLYSTEPKSIIDFYEKRGVEINVIDGETYFIARDNKKIVDNDLAYISSLNNVTVVNLNKTRIADKGISYLINLKELRYLDLGSTDITDSASIYIGQLTKLEELSLASTRVTNRSLRNIFKLKNLKEMNLYSTDIVLKGWPEIDVTEVKLSFLYTPMIELRGNQNIEWNILFWSKGVAPATGEYIVGSAQESSIIQLNFGDRYIDKESLVREKYE